MTLTAWLGPLLMLTPLGPMNDHRANDLRPWNGTWPMFGGNPSRNMVNEVDRNLPADWCVEEGKLKNIAWQADLGSRTFGTPVVADGRVFVGTTNGRPRNSAAKDPKAVLMAFRQPTASFSGRICTTSMAITATELPGFVGCCRRRWWMANKSITSRPTAR